jgi:hypothetical protein
MPLTTRHAATQAPLPYWAILTIILLATVATRFSAFGNPTYSSDDPVFLLIGQAILDGQMPYVDIWDRKPIGIYLIFAGIRLLGGTGIVESQLVAGLFAFATAVTIERSCRYFAGQQGSILATFTYLMFLPMFRGAAAQATIFYNLFMALAAFLVIRSIFRAGPPTMRTCIVAMLLCGLSMLVKQTTAIEGCLFGLALVVIGLRRGWNPKEAVQKALLMIGVALLPTLASLAAFAWLGHLGDYWFAAFRSNQLRAGDIAVGRGLSLAKLALPLVLVAFWGLISRIRRGEREINFFILGWTTCALASLFVIPLFYFYYFTPVLLPLIASAATILDQRRGGLLVFSLLLSFTIVQGSILSWPKTREAQSQYRALSQAVDRNLNEGCLFVASGPPSLYVTTHACRPTRFIFPGHLVRSMEAAAIPVDGSAELNRILELEPQVILFDTMPDSDFRNLAFVRTLRAQLERHYVHEGRYPQLSDDIPRLFDVWVRRGSEDSSPLAQPLPPQLDQQE